MSPDNVILENDDIHEAKIIDFGIAKDLDASSATIVGDGFAGKLNYVAPEQLGDFGREIGPWTDVYSLGLVILAVAQGKNVDMSGSLVDAIDKRRKGPDLSRDPGRAAAAARGDAAARSQGAAALDGRGAGDARRRPHPLADHGRARSRGRGRRPRPATRRRRRRRRGQAAADHPRRARRRRSPLLAAAWYSTGGDLGLGDGADGNAAGRRQRGRRRSRTGRSGRDRARRDRFGAALGHLHLARHRRDRGGRAGSRRDARRRRQRRRGAGASSAGRWPRPASPNARRRFRRRRADHPGGCAALDTFRQIRATGAPRLAGDRSRASRWRPRPDGDYAGRAAANALVDLNLGDAGRDFALLGIEPSGAITMLLSEPRRRSSRRSPARAAAGRSATRAMAATGCISTSTIRLVGPAAGHRAGAVRRRRCSRPTSARAGPDWQRPLRRARPASSAGAPRWSGSNR